MKNKPIKWGFKFWFRFGAKSCYLYEFDMYLGKKGNTEFGLGESVVLSLCQKLKDTHCFVFFDNFFTSAALLVTLLEMGIYATGTVRANRKNMPVLKHDKEMKAASMIGFLQITFQPLSGWTISQLYFYPITSTQRRT